MVQASSSVGACVKHVVVVAKGNYLQKVQQNNVFVSPHTMPSSSLREFIM